MGLFLFILATLALMAILSLVPVIRNSMRMRKVLSNVPGRAETPILGHALYYVGKKSHDIVEILRESFAECGKTWKLFLLHETQVITSDPKVCELILSSPKTLTKSIEYNVTRNWLGDGLLLSKGKKWHSRRKILTPSFHFKILEQFVEIFDKNASILSGIVAEKSKDGPLDIFPLVGLTALDNICETSMGASINAQLNSESSYVLAVKEMARIITIRSTQIIHRNDFLYKFTKTRRQEKENLKILHNFTDNVIMTRRQELLKAASKPEEGEKSHDSEDLGMKRRVAFLDILLQSTIDGKPLTNADIREEVDIVVFAGHDTTSLSVSFGLYCLAKNPEIQKRVLEEIESVVGKDKDTKISLQNFNEMPYFDATIKEILRMYTPAPIIGRHIEEDFVVNENLTLPKGTNLMLGLMFMHNDPDLYPEPKAFRPERFMGERSDEKLNPYSYIPFSAGPRNCIGQKFGTLVAKTVISRLLRNFEISVDPSYKEPILGFELVLKSENGVSLVFKPRQ